MNNFNLHTKILGSYGGRCQRLGSNVRELVASPGFRATIEKVEDTEQLMVYKINRIPVMLINEKVYSERKSLSQKQINTRIE